MSIDNIPNGHERSYRRGKADALSLDRRSAPSEIIRSEDLPKGHDKSYEKGFKAGVKELDL